MIMMGYKELETLNGRNKVNGEIENEV
jgi:hypothetical protein